mgnify:CR=1 FL=1
MSAEQEFADYLRSKPALEPFLQALKHRFEQAGVWRGKIVLEDGTIYGSGRTLLQDVFNLIDELKIPVPQAAAMASLNAARFLHVEDRLGSLKAGKQADFIVVDDQHRCLVTLQRGIKVCDIGQRSRLANPEFAKLKIA